MLDEQLHALADPHRRRLLVALMEHNPQDEVSIPDGVQVGRRDREVLEAEMVHAHLPKLERAGFVRWDRDAKEVRKGPRYDEIRPLLELLDDNADRLAADWP